MDLATIATLIGTGKSLLEVGKTITSIIIAAKISPDSKAQVLFYLEAVQASVLALGLERQYILTDVRHCDVGDPQQVEAIWKRLDTYLLEDHVRSSMQMAIDGLAGCHWSIASEAKSTWWRKSDKREAVKEFENLMHVLLSTLRGLTSDFLPGGSGMGVRTLIPIYKKLKSIRAARQRGRISHSQALAMNWKLRDLVAEALADSSNEEWYQIAGKVEGLVARLKFAFSIRVLQKRVPNPQTLKTYIE